MKRILFLIILFTSSVSVAFSQCVTNAGPDITICGGEEVGLGGITPAGSSSLWVGGLGTFSGGRTNDTAVYTPNASEVGTSIQLILTTTGGGCPNDSDTMYITVNNTPDLYNLTGFALNVCPATSVDLSSVNIVDSNNAGGTYTYEDAGFNPLASSIVTTNGIYYVRKTTNSFPPCEDFVSVAVIITTCAGCSNPPSLTANETNVTCNGDGDGAIDIVLAGGVPPVGYAWSNGATTEDLSGLSGGVYTVTVTDNENCTSELTVVVNEPAALDATITPVGGSTAFCPNPGVGVLFQSVINPNVTKQWYKFANLLVGETGDTYLADKASGYKLLVTDSNGCSKFGPTVLTTKLPLPPSTITVIGNTSFCGGDSAVLMANSGPYTYGWLRYGRVQNGQTSQTYAALRGGRYKATVTDTNGCFKNSALLILTKWPNPKSNVTPTTAQLPSPICFGDSTLLTGIPSFGTPPYTYQWYRYNSVLAGQTNLTYTATQGGGYSIRVVDVNGCARKSARTVITTTCRFGSNEYALTNNLNLHAFPNPFRNEVTLVLDNFSDEKVKIMVRDAIGKIVYESVESAEFEYKLNTSDYNSGLYFIELSQGSEVQRIKLIKSE